MAAELQYRHSATGSTIRATVRKETTVGGKVQMWNGLAWEDLTVANWATYLVTLTETPASSYSYVGDMPALVPAWYYIDIYSGTAISSTLEATLFGYWDGTTLVLGAKAAVATLPTAAENATATWSVTLTALDALGATTVGKWFRTVLAGITSLAAWLRAGLRSSTPDATALSEINTGGGTYSATTDSQEAIGTKTAAYPYTILPSSGSSSADGSWDPFRWTAYQYCTIGSIVHAVLDSDDAAINLSGKNLAIVFSDQTTGATAFTLKNYGGATDITIGGASNNELTITGAAANTATRKTYDVAIKEVTNTETQATGTCYGYGTLEVKRAGAIS